jgi:hypothetical protein
MKQIAFGISLLPNLLTGVISFGQGIRVRPIGEFIQIRLKYLLLTGRRWQQNIATYQIKEGLLKSD